MTKEEITKEDIYKAFIKYNGNCESGILRLTTCGNCLLSKECNYLISEGRNTDNTLKKYAEEKLFQLTFDEQVDKLLTT